MRLVFLLTLISAFIIIFANGAHFLGGTMTWRLLNELTIRSPVPLIITQTYLWIDPLAPCTNSMVSMNTFIPNSSGVFASGKLKCKQSRNRRSLKYTNIDILPRCTDFSMALGINIAQRSDIVYLNEGDSFRGVFVNKLWPWLTRNVNISHPIEINFQMTRRFGYGLYNNAPVAAMISPILVPYNKTTLINVPAVDADGDTIRCRLANRSTGTNNERIGNRSSRKGSSNIRVLSNCSVLITSININDWYFIDIVVEDFIEPTSTTPLSSIPVQFITQVVNLSTYLHPPKIVGVPSELSCIPVTIDQTFTTELIATNSHQPTLPIIDISTFSFLGMRKSSINKLNSTHYYKRLSWKPAITQRGFHTMCSMAFNSESVPSNQYCFIFYVSENKMSECPSYTTPTTKSSQINSAMRKARDMNVLIIGGPAAITTTTETTSTTSTSTTTSTTSSATTTTSATTSTSTTTSTTSSSTTTTTSVQITTTTKKNDINWPLIASIISLALLSALTLCCCLWWSCGCPLGCLRLPINESATPELYHIERSAYPDYNSVTIPGTDLNPPPSHSNIPFSRTSYKSSLSRRPSFPYKSSLSRRPSFSYQSSLSQPTSFPYKSSLSHRPSFSYQSNLSHRPSFSYQSSLSHRPSFSYQSSLSQPTSFPYKSSISQQRSINYSSAYRLPSMHSVHTVSNPSTFGYQSSIPYSNDNRQLIQSSYRTVQQPLQNTSFINTRRDYNMPEVEEIVINPLNSEQQQGWQHNVQSNVTNIEQLSPSIIQTEITQPHFGVNQALQRTSFRDVYDNTTGRTWKIRKTQTYEVVRPPNVLMAASNQYSNNKYSLSTLNTNVQTNQNSNLHINEIPYVYSIQDSNSKLMSESLKTREINTGFDNRLIRSTTIPKSTILTRSAKIKSAIDNPVPSSLKNRHFLMRRILPSSKANKSAKSTNQRSKSNVTARTLDTSNPRNGVYVSWVQRENTD